MRVILGWYFSRSFDWLCSVELSLFSELPSLVEMLWPETSLSSASKRGVGVSFSFAYLFFFSRVRRCWFICALLHLEQLGLFSLAFCPMSHFEIIVDCVRPAGRKVIVWLLFSNSTPFLFLNNPSSLVTLVLSRTIFAESWPDSK